MKDGKYQWSIITKMIGGWKLLPILVENTDRLMDIFKDRKAQFGLDPICTVPTSGTGNTYPTFRTIGGAKYQKSNLKDHFELLKDIHTLTLSYVRAFSSWFMGGEASMLSTSADMQIKAIDPNKVENVGLLNQHKIRLCCLSGTLHFILKNHVTLSSYNSFMPSIRICLYKDKVTGRQVICGLILVKMAMEVMKPQLVINHREKEKALEALTLLDSDNNVCTFLTRMQDQHDKIDTLQKDGVKYDKQRFLAFMFEKLLETNRPDFQSEVKLARNQWVKNPSATDKNNVIARFINLYSTIKANGEWEHMSQTEMQRSPPLRLLSKLQRKPPQRQTKSPQAPSSPTTT